MKPVRLVAGTAALLFAMMAMSADQTARFDVTLAGDKQPLHVLNRVAFGPRPGDVEAVRRIGVKEWLRQQLEPAKLPANPVLDTRLKRLVTLELPTWKMIQDTQPQTMQTASMMVMTPPLPAETMARIRSPSTTPEERTSILMSLTPEVRSQALVNISPQLLEALPELRREAEKAQQARQEMAERARAEQRRRLAPPLSELFTPDELNVLRHGTEQEKTALIEPLDATKRGQVFRSMGPQGAQLLPAAFQRQAMLASNPQQGVVDEVIEAKLQRAVHSNRQLEEVLVDFWFNHFNVSVTKPQVRMLLTSYERDAIRPHVLGKFRDMLLATARHPAMLFYLDNYQSQVPQQNIADALARAGLLRGPGINENYARELMELHTLGVDGGYTQEDVVNVARVFTGWTIFDVQRVGEFQFNPASHDRNEKRVLGHVIPAGGGENEGVQVIDILARHSSTARFISRKLAQRFVADAPPAALVDRMAETFMKTDGDLRAVMETLLFSKEFLSEGAWRSKMKSPLEMVASSLRALDADVSDTTMLARHISDLGQPLYAKLEPTGYPNTGEIWSNSVALLGRMNFASALLGGQIKGVEIKPEVIASKDLRRSMLALTGVAATPQMIAAVEKGAGGAPPAPTLMATVLIGSPDFQKR